MKKLMSIAVMTFLMILMSCQKSFIDLQPTDTVDVASLYSTDSDFNDAVNGCYTAFQAAYSNWWKYGDIRADDFYDELIKGDSYFDIFTLDVNDGDVSSSWRNWYIVISRANELLFRIKDKDAAVVTNKDRYIAEAKFIRALTYFNLVRVFGDVPMLTVPVTSVEAYTIPREPLANIYNTIIIPDLLVAEAGLPVKYTGTNVGKATSGAAKALLGDVYLTLHDFAKAEPKLGELTKAPYTYSLLPKYSDLFDYTKDEHHAEYIFDIEYITGGLGLGSSMTTNFCPKDPPTLAFYKLTTGNGQNNPTFAYGAMFETGDLRKDVAFANGFTDANGVYHKLLQNSNDVQTYTRKYIIAPSSPASDSPANWKVYRYGDVVLMYAEALNENGKTTEALVQLNKIRTRAGVSVYSALTQAATRDAIALERRFELGGEGKRWFDLVRTGKALSTMAPIGMKDYMTIWPVPQNQIDLYNNPAIFWQNPGYN
jgi:starch-binding outer membrane protein, SusD/RagB family